LKIYWLHAGDAQVAKSELRTAAFGTTGQKARPKATMGNQKYSRQRNVKRLLSPTLSSKGGEAENFKLNGSGVGVRGRKV
jgi:hypothetical protein